MDWECTACSTVSCGLFWSFFCLMVGKSLSGLYLSREGLLFGGCGWGGLAFVLMLYGDYYGFCFFRLWEVEKDFFLVKW